MVSRALENIRDIFSILHDGDICAWNGDKNLLTLTVECQYLAKRIDPSFDKFYVELFNIDKLELEPWRNSVDVAIPDSLYQCCLPDAAKIPASLLSKSRRALDFSHNK